MTDGSIQVQQLKEEKRSALEQVQSHLGEVAVLGREELKPQAILRAEENKRNKLSTIVVKLESYGRQT